MALNLRESVIITGASEGIGRAMALEFAKRGFSLGLIARRLELLQSLEKECLALGSPIVKIEAVDVTDEVNFEQALNRLDEALFGAEIFVANAGIIGKSSNRSDSWIQAKKTLTVNVLAAVHGLEVMKHKMLNRGHGILSGVGSVAGARGLPTSGPYSSSKAALNTYLESMRIDLKHLGIAVVTIAPGFVDTAMTKKNNFTMPFMISAEKAAKIYVDGLLAKKAWIVAPRVYGFIYSLTRMTPRCLYDYVAGRAYKSERD